MATTGCSVNWRNNWPSTRHSLAKSKPACEIMWTWVNQFTFFGWVFLCCEALPFEVWFGSAFHGSCATTMSRKRLVTRIPFHGARKIVASPKLQVGSWMKDVASSGWCDGSGQVVHKCSSDLYHEEPVHNNAKRCHAVSGTTTSEPSFHARFLEAIHSPKWPQLKMRHMSVEFHYSASKCCRPMQGQQSVQGVVGGGFSRQLSSSLEGQSL